MTKYERRLREGVCIWCRLPATEDGMCRNCAYSERTHKCIQCYGKPDRDVECLECAEKSKAWEAEWDREAERQTLLSEAENRKRELRREQWKLAREQEKADKIRVAREKAIARIKIWVQRFEITADEIDLTTRGNDDA